MDKGIRPECNRKFMEELPKRENTRAGNTQFRKNVMCHIMEQFGITLASAATHYNHAFIDAREKAKADENLAKLLEGLGRPEDKKGGRKKKEAPAAAPAAQTSDAAPPPPAAVISDAAASTGLESLQQTNSDDPPGGDAPQDEVPAETLYSVRKVSDGTVVCEGLTLEKANELIEKAAKAKKGKLELVQ